MTTLNDTEVYFLWWISVAVAFVVVIVAAGLFVNILLVAKHIEGNVSTILGGGAKILETTSPAANRGQRLRGRRPDGRQRPAHRRGLCGDCRPRQAVQALSRLRQSGRRPAGDLAPRHLVAGDTGGSRRGG